MKILFTGGGTGGHFYPIIAIAEEIRELAIEEKLVGVKLYFASVDKYNDRLLFENDITFVGVTAGKIRRYFSIANFFDLFKTAFGIIRALWKLYWLYPDVVFGKGGFASFPMLVAARIIRIPVVIHESDSHPGKVNLWAKKFAQKIAVSYPEALEYFPKEKTALTGNPLRKEILNPITEGAHEFLKLDPGVPTIFITGGSQGAQPINEAVLAVLPELVKNFQVIHQVGQANYADIKTRTGVIIGKDPNFGRYHLYESLNDTALRMMAGVSKLIISRAGSTIFEIAHWGIPSIIIPLPESISHDQTMNAFTYARNGGAVVIEQTNLTPSVLLSEIHRLMASPDLRLSMSQKAREFSRPDAARLIGKELISIALSHEE